jgi:hypothetical protein
LTNSISVRGFALFQRAAKKKTVPIVAGTPHHQYQLRDIPEVTTIPERAKGVSAAKVVATIDVPSNHHVVPPPDLKYSDEEERPRLMHIIPKIIEITR